MNTEPNGENIEDKNEQTREEILDALEFAFNEKSQVELSVLESSEEVKTGKVFVEEFEDGILYVSESESSPVFSIELDRIKKATPVESVNDVITEEIEAGVAAAKEGEKDNPKKIEALKGELEKEFENKEKKDNLTKIEVFEFLNVDIEKCSIVEEKYDDDGLKSLEFRVEGQEENHVIQYLYTRDMKSSEKTPHFGKLETDIYQTIYDENGDFVQYPENIYRYENGEWKKL